MCRIGRTVGLHKEVGGSAIEALIVKYQFIIMMGECDHCLIVAIELTE